MNITGSEHRQKLLSWADELATLMESRDNEVAAAVRKSAESYREHRFVLTVLGKAKRGKSTLINALLGRRDDELAPVDQLPASNVLCRFVRGDTLTARVFFRPVSPGAKAVHQSIAPRQIREFVTEEGNPENRRQVECVEVVGPFDDFDQDLTLVDTPGTGSIHTYHDEIVRTVIPQSDAVLFLVTARMPLDQDELELLKQLRNADIKKIVFVINRVDQSTSEELEQAESHNRSLLQQAGIVVDQIHRISAKKAFDGSVTDSGLSTLVDEIRQLLREGKAATLAERLVSRVHLQVNPVLTGMEAEMALLGQSAESLERTREELVRQRSKVSLQREHAERRFELAWQRALDQMALDVKNARGAVEQRLLQQINAVSVTGIGKLAKEFPSRLVAEVEEAVRPHAEQMELALQDACRELDAGYPAVDVSGLETIGPMRTKGSLAPSLVYGTTLVAGGGAALAAAQAAAASAFQVVTTQSLAGAGLSWFLGIEVPLLTSSVVPAALPAWAVIAGPVGWTLIGLGALAIPFGWSISRTRMKDQLRDQATQQVDQVFRFLLEDRLPFIRQNAQSIVAEYCLRSERELAELEAAVSRATAAPDPVAERNRLSELHQTLSRLGDAPGTSL